MDIFAHILWTYIFFRKDRFTKFAIIVGIMPDLLTWGTMISYNFLIGIKLNFIELSSRTSWEMIFGGIPPWVLSLYGITHSLIVAGVVLAALYVMTRKFYPFLLAWPLHIGLDIFSHSRNHLPTPFLWPVSNYAFPGIRFTEIHFLVANYLAIFAILIYINRAKIREYLTALY